MFERAPRGDFYRYLHFLFVGIAVGGWGLSAFGEDFTSSFQPQIAPRTRSGGSQALRSTPNLRLDVKMVLVPVSVTDAAERPITTLPQESFRLLEDGVEQSITSFSQEEGPVSLGILFDTSGSMKYRLETSVAALHEFFKTSVTGDEFFVVQFADQAKLLTGFTPLPDEIFGKLGVVQAKGWTAMLDAIALGSHKMRTAKNPRKILLVLSDGGDNNSRFTESEIRTMVLESDLRVYSIGLLHRPRFLQQLSEETGGNSLTVQNLSELPEVVQKLSAEIRSQYVLGYSSNLQLNDGKYHKVKVELLQPTGKVQLRASWRRGYYAPGE
jgi:VWFA-related protein